MKASDAVTQLAALAQESRLNIFRLLVVAGTDGLTPGKISEELGIPAATLSFHLKELSRAELIDARQESRYIHYSANYQQMNQLLGFLTEKWCAGKSCELKPNTTAKGSSPKPKRKQASK